MKVSYNPLQSNGNSAALRLNIPYDAIIGSVQYDIAVCTRNYVDAVDIKVWSITTTTPIRTP